MGTEVGADTDAVADRTRDSCTFALAASTGSAMSFGHFAPLASGISGGTMNGELCTLTTNFKVWFCFHCVHVHTDRCVYVCAYVIYTYVDTFRILSI